MLGVKRFADTFTLVAVAIKQPNSSRINHPLLFPAWDQTTKGMLAGHGKPQLRGVEYFRKGLGGDHPPHVGSETAADRRSRTLTDVHERLFVPFFINGSPWISADVQQKMCETNSGLQRQECRV
jgi:hypothetical protein